MAKNKRLSTWLRSGVIEQNIKDTLKSTLDKLYSICPLNISRSSLRDSLHDNLYHDEAFRQNPAHTKIFNWFEALSQKTRSARPVAIFKKTRLYSSVVGQQDSSSATINNYNNNGNKRTREVSPPVKQAFSFTASEQGAVVEPLLNLVEKAIYKFLVDSESFIPLDVVKSFCVKQHPPISTDFGDADLLCMINFIIENIKLFVKQKKPLFHGRYKANPAELLSNFKKNVRNKMAHGIVVDEKGRWSDHELQHISLLACEVVICLGGDCKEASSNKENIDNELVRRWINKADKEHSHPPQKRKLDDTNLGKITEFVLDILEETEEIEKGDKRKILGLALNEDEYIIKLWRAIKIEEKQVQIRKFIQSANLMFDVVSI
ncbi:4733_t:CDS:2 [Dentiscutata heterogama]|uniref:4733_t:CDS:1 n=1 Tax=Dentiscutata heterogama TaxID=1316150 RepID=A0ACA9K7J6_9GLOM|nr:4733_t:CDS:2 [Dentiscutata heterogama]